LADLPNAPTTAPSPDGGYEIWYADYADWSEGKCINKHPAPIGRKTYDTQLECCKGQYPSQTSGACLAALPNAPTTAPSPDGGYEIWYANHDVDWANGYCINKHPAPNGRVVYDSELECCQKAYDGQASGACLQELPSPPTASPVGNDALFFPIFTNWETGHCDNDPTKITPGTNYFYEDKMECCDKWFKDQSSKFCIKFDPTYGTLSPTQAPVQ
jgi:hypothetical protein